MRVLPPRMQDKLYHDIILPEETLEIRKKARLFVEKYIFPEGLRSKRFIGTVRFLRFTKELMKFRNLF